MGELLRRVNDLLRKAADNSDFGALFEELCEQLADEGIPLWRASVGYRTLDPVVRARSDVWQPRRPLSSMK